MAENFQHLENCIKKLYKAYEARTTPNCLNEKRKKKERERERDREEEEEVLRAHCIKIRQRSV